MSERVHTGSCRAGSYRVMSILLPGRGFNMIEGSTCILYDESGVEGASQLSPRGFNNEEHNLVNNNSNIVQN